MPDWLSQGLITNGVYAVLVVIGGSFVAWIRKSESQDKATAILYGLAGSALLLLIFVQTKVLLYDNIPHQPPIVNSEIIKQEHSVDLEKKIREWLYAANYKTQQAKPLPNEKFRLL